MTILVGLGMTVAGALLVKAGRAWAALGVVVGGVGFLACVLATLVAMGGG